MSAHRARSLPARGFRARDLRARCRRELVARHPVVDSAARLGGSLAHRPRAHRLSRAPRRSKYHQPVQATRAARCAVFRVCLCLFVVRRVLVCPDCCGPRARDRRECRCCVGRPRVPGARGGSVGFCRPPGDGWGRRVRGRCVVELEGRQRAWGWVVRSDLCSTVCSTQGPARRFRLEPMVWRRACDVSVLLGRVLPRCRRAERGCAVGRVLRVRRTPRPRWVRVRRLRGRSRRRRCGPFRALPGVCFRVVRRG